MSIKTLRVVIACAQLQQCISLEKVLNHLGCYRVIPLLSWVDVLKLTQVPSCPVDLLILDTSLPLSSIDTSCLLKIGAYQPSAKFILYYGKNTETGCTEHELHSQFVQCSLEDQPDHHLLSLVLSMIQSVTTTTVPFNRNRLKPSIQQTRSGADQYSIISTG